jgi:hypothetical protein
VKYGAGRRPTVRSRRLKSFLYYALGSIGAFAMAGRVVQWLNGPLWLSLAFAGVGLALGGYYLVRALLGLRSSRRAS